MSYAAFVEAKAVTAPAVGLDADRLHEKLFPWQAAVTRWALRRGRAALFEDCGLGKTFQQLEWARHIPGRVLILTPLAVAQQTVAEAARFGIPATYARAETDAQIVVTNYEMLPAVQLPDSARLNAFPMWRNP